MAIKSVSTRIAIVGRGAKCRGGKSAVEQSSYISRTTLQCEYDGMTYYPKYSEDLVHTEIMLPINAPPEYQDRSVLWNSVEMREKNSSRAQLARSMRVTLPNAWSYEIATEMMQGFVKRTFVDEGMCAEWAIHDSEHNGQRNLHCHILLTVRPILEDGSWGEKQKKVYQLDKDGNKVRTRSGNYKCSTVDLTGWNQRENAKKWRKQIADTINSVNESLQLDERWDERSFKERGLDIEPTIHLGAQASALERQGIQTERGNINREILKHNFLLEQAKALYEEAKEVVERLKSSKVVVAVKNEIIDLIDKIVEKKGRLDLPIVRGKYLAKVSNRNALQSKEQTSAFIVHNEIETFEELDRFRKQQEVDFTEIDTERQELITKIDYLTGLVSLYHEFEPYLEVKKQSIELKGLSKSKFDKEHEQELLNYSEYRERLENKLPKGAKPTPKAWEKKINTLQEKLNSTNPKYARTVSDLAYAEVISFNKKNYEREQANEHGNKSRRKEQEIE